MRESKEQEPLHIKCTFISESDKAFLASFHDDEGVKLGQLWLPKSRVKQVVRGCGGFVVSAERGEEILIELPVWLAEKDNIAKLIRDQVLDTEAMLDDESMNEDEEDDEQPF